MKNYQNPQPQAPVTDKNKKKEDDSNEKTLKEQNKELDDSLKDTFPASDPVQH